LWIEKNISFLLKNLGTLKVETIISLTAQIFAIQNENKKNLFCSFSIGRFSFIKEKVTGLLYLVPVLK